MLWPPTENGAHFLIVLYYYLFSGRRKLICFIIIIVCLLFSWQSGWTKTSLVDLKKRFIG